MQTIVKVDENPRRLAVNLRRDYLGTIASLEQRYGSTFAIPFKPFNAVVLLDPVIIHRVLVEDAQHFIKGAEIAGSAFNLLKRKVGDAIFITDDQSLWQRHRKIVVPYFERSMLDEYSHVINKNTMDMLARYQHAESIVITEEMPKLGLINLIASVFGKSSFDIDAMLSISENHRSRTDTEGKAFKSAMQLFDDIAAKYVEQSLEDTDNSGSILGNLFAAYSDHSDSDYAFNAVKEEFKGLIIAGHETVSAALSWACYLLARHPEIQELLFQESQQILRGEPANYHHIKEMPMIKSVFYEVLRLYPPIYTLSRYTVGDQVIDDVLFPDKSYLMISVLNLHRSSKNWVNPNEFTPSRFLGQQSLASYPGYMPFGLGLRSCLGREYALMEFCLVMINILRGHTIEGNFDKEVIMNPRSSLWPRDPLVVKFRPRV